MFAAAQIEGESLGTQDRQRKRGKAQQVQCGARGAAIFAGQSVCASFEHQAMKACAGSSNIT